MLDTSEPIDIEAQLLQIVDWYRARWTIEEFFKALKTGCAYEERQMEDLHGLTNVLALFAPIAWHLTVLRAFARKPLPKKPTAPCVRIVVTSFDPLRAVSGAA